MNHSKIKESDQVYLPPYLEELNSPQRESVQNLKGPVLMLAGAGTGFMPTITPKHKCDI